MKRNIKSSRTTLPVALRSALTTLTNQHDNGVITLDQFHRAVTKHMPGIQKETSMNFLKNAPGGWFVVGRKGHKSRFLFNDAFEDFRKSELRRREWRRQNGQPDNIIPHLKGGKFRPEDTENDTGTVSKGGKGQGRKGKGTSTNLSLHVTAGGRKVKVPVILEVVED